VNHVSSVVLVYFIMAIFLGMFGVHLMFNLKIEASFRHEDEFMLIKKTS
jgi:hypothetical protein